MSKSSVLNFTEKTFFGLNHAFLLFHKLVILLKISRKYIKINNNF